ncbi:MAG: isocitrate/isopropylmalate family dehydrogenase, partial [Micromonosporaceae bacterium]
VRFPQQMDVVLTMNLYGDILSDLGAETAGGLGMAPSGCFREGWAYFESVHGSAPDIAGRGIANPTATLLSAAMMLDDLGCSQAAQLVRQGVSNALSDPANHTPDLGGDATTTDLASAVLNGMEN